jgi:hypothetical protein
LKLPDLEQTKGYGHCIHQKDPNFFAMIQKKEMVPAELWTSLFLKLAMASFELNFHQ